MTLSLHISSQAQTGLLQVAWANSIGGSGDDHGNRLVADSMGNVYVAGTFEKSITTPVENKTIISKGGRDIFLCKYNSVGKMIAIVALGGEGDDAVNAIHCDTKGNIYVAGYFEKELIIDEPSKKTHFSNGGQDMYYAVFDNTLQYITSHSFGGIMDDEILNISTALTGDILISGYYQNTINMASSQSAVTLSAKGFSDMFFATYTLNGICKYAKSLNLVTFSRAVKTTFDKKDNIVISGIFEGTTDFDAGAAKYIMTSNRGRRDIFIAKYSNDGNFLRAHQIGGPDVEMIYDLKINNNNETIVCGYFQATVNFDLKGGNSVLTAINQQDGFVASYDENSNIIFAQHFSATAGANPYHLGIDSKDNIYLLGSFLGKGEFYTKQNNTNEIISHGNADVFVAKYTPMGEFKYAMNFGGNDNEAAQYIYTGSNNLLYVTGDFELICTFAAGQKEILLQSSGKKDAFVLTLKTDYTPTYKYSLSGRVKGEEHTLVDGKITLIRKIGNNFSEVATTLFHNNAFLFSGIEKGTYTLYAVADTALSNQYFPTYYAGKRLLEKSNLIDLYGNITEVDLQLLNKTQPPTSDARVWIYPNKIDDSNMLNINFSTAHTSMYISVADIQGKIHIEKQLPASSIPQSYSLQFNNIESGVYFGKIYNNTEQLLTFKVVK